MADAALASPLAARRSRASREARDSRLAEAPPAARFILRGRRGGARRLRDGVRRRAAFAARPGGRGGRARGAVARARRMAADRGRRRRRGRSASMLESVLEGTAHSLVDVSHRQIGLIASGPAAARVLNAGCPLDLEPHGLSGRLRDAHPVRQSGDRALAPRRGDVPCRSLAIVRALSRRLARRGRARRAAMVTGVGWNERPGDGGRCSNTRKLIHALAGII